MILMGPICAFVLERQLARIAHMFSSQAPMFVYGKQFTEEKQKILYVTSFHLCYPYFNMEWMHHLTSALFSLYVQVLLCCRDARLIKIKRNHQSDRCLCLFAVIFYKDQCPGSKEKVISGTIADVVTIDDICILQNLQPEELQDGSVRWNSAVDCFHHNRSKLLSARFSLEVAYLIVLSSLRRMEFNIKMVDGNIIYQIIKGDQARDSIDSMSIPPGFGKNMDIISFKPRGEALRPITRTVPVTQVEEGNLTEDGCIAVKGESDSAQDVEILYAHVDIRRSKRMKTQPDRFTSYDARNFNRTYNKKEADGPSTKYEDSESGLSCDSSEQRESSDEEALENPRSMAAEHKYPVKRNQCSLPVKEKQISMEIKKNTTDQGCSDSYIPHTPAKNTERPRFRLKPFASSRSLDGNSEPAFCQKRGRKRKKHMCQIEYKRMIDQCIGNIQCEVERDSDFKFGDQILDGCVRAYQEVDFTWPSSADSQEEKDELDELWKEMDYALATVAILEQKQVSGFVL
jgi:DNA repair and recombination protein RAD54 and RAD54-like protein